MSEWLSDGVGGHLCSEGVIVVEGWGRGVGGSSQVRFRIRILQPSPFLSLCRDMRVTHTTQELGKQPSHIDAYQIFTTHHQIILSHLHHSCIITSSHVDEYKIFTPRQVDASSSSYHHISTCWCICHESHYKAHFGPWKAHTPDWLSNIQFMEWWWWWWLWWQWRWCWHFPKVVFLSTRLSAQCQCTPDWDNSVTTSWVCSSNLSWKS